LEMLNKIQDDYEALLGFNLTGKRVGLTSRLILGLKNVK